jgi:FSR family fosmidomycin resistance protein-like MFS transporter
MLAPVLPLVVDRLGLGLAAAGFLGSAFSLTNLVQPLLGLWADRMRRRWLVLAGLALTALFMPLLGVAPGYWSLVFILTAGGFGVAAFHPQVASLVGDLSGDRRAFGISLFVFGGTLGLGLTPFWVPAIASRVGLAFLPFLSIPGVILFFVVWRLVPLDNPQFESRKLTTWRASFDGRGWALTYLTFVVTMRTMTNLSIGYFLTMLYRERGFGLVEGAIPLGIYNISAVLGGLLLGYCADRTKPKPLVWGSILLSAPALYGWLHTDGTLSLVLLALGGALILGSNPITVAMAQQLAPKNAAFASGLPLGFSWGIAGLLLVPIGYVAEQIGVANTLSYLALLPLVTGLLAMRLPTIGAEPRVQRG